MFKKIISIIISHTIFITNPSCNRICLTRRTTNNHINSLSLIYKIIKPFATTKFFIIPSRKKFCFSLNIKMHHSLCCIFYFPFCFQSTDKCIYLWFKPFNSRNIYISATLEKTILQSSTPSK